MTDTETARVRWQHPRTNAWGVFEGELINRHAAGRVTVRIVVEGRTYYVTGDEK